MSKAYFVAGMRTPFGKAFKGAYKDLRPDDLIVELIHANRKRHPEIWKSAPDDFILGCAYPEGEQGYNVGRQVALGAGLDVPGMTVNRLCASSLDAVGIAAAKIRAGWASRMLVGGLESMSRVPRRGSNFSESEKVREVCPAAYINNGDTAEKVARQYPSITRLKQEDLAARSHELAAKAFDDGLYVDQIHPFLVERDEFIRVPVDRAKMASLAPAFSETGVVTAATSSPLTDGATCGWVLDENAWRESGNLPALEIIDIAAGHVPPDVMGMGPVPATQKVLKRNQLKSGQIAAWEINEAFAIQVLASMEELDIPMDRMNCWGGAMAVGHPLGASGLRLMMTLHNRMVRNNSPGDLGIATLCVGGGQGVSVLARLARQAV